MTFQYQLIKTCKNNILSDAWSYNKYLESSCGRLNDAEARSKAHGIAM